MLYFGCMKFASRAGKRSDRRFLLGLIKELSVRVRYKRPPRVELFGVTWVGTEQTVRHRRAASLHDCGVMACVNRCPEYDLVIGPRTIRGCSSLAGRGLYAYHCMWCDCVFRVPVSEVNA